VFEDHGQTWQVVLIRFGGLKWLHDQLNSRFLMRRYAAVRNDLARVWLPRVSVVAKSSGATKDSMQKMESFLTGMR
jgi:hypothetical protein